jgi:hypothetical protein
MWSGVRKYMKYKGLIESGILQSGLAACGELADQRLDR